MQVDTHGITCTIAFWELFHFRYFHYPAPWRSEESCPYTWQPGSWVVQTLFCCTTAEATQFKRNNPKMMLPPCLNSQPHKTGHSFYASSSWFPKLCPNILPKKKKKKHLWENCMLAFLLDLLLTMSFITLFPGTSSTQKTKREGFKVLCFTLHWYSFYFYY